jgi:hypothetical protein
MNPSRIFAVLMFAFPLAGLGAASGTATSTTLPAPGLHFAAETPGSLAAVQWALDFYYNRNPSRTPEMTDRSKLDIQPPIACYKLGTADFLGGKGPSAAKLFSYTYNIKVGGKIVAAIMLCPFPDGTFHNGSGYVSAFKDSQIATATLSFKQTLTQIKALEQVRNGSYELRMLILPPYKKTGAPPPNDGVSTSVYWLKSNTGGGDLFYTSTFSADEPGLQPSTLYTLSQLMNAIAPAVKRFASLPNPTRYSPAN